MFYWRFPMLYLLLAILSSTTISLIMRLSSDRVQAKLSMLATNYVICALLSAFYAGFRLYCPQISGFPTTVGLGLIGGVLFLGGFVFLQENTRKNGIVLSSLFMKLGLLVPIVMSVLFFHERPSALQAAGFALAITAILLISLKKDDKGHGFSFSLILLLLFGGGSDAMSKVYEHWGNAVLSQQFLFYTFLTAFVLCLILIVRKRERPRVTELVFGALIGVPNFFSSKFLLASLGQLPAVVVYPSFSVATLLLVTIGGMVFFNERLSKLRWLALALILVALVLLNI